jgi:hypothetical protein
MGLRSTARADVEWFVRLGAATCALPFTTELTAVLPSKETSAESLCEHFMLLVPSSGLVASRDVVTIPAEAHCADGEEDERELGAKGAGMFKGLVLSIRRWQNRSFRATE